MLIIYFIIYYNKNLKYLVYNRKFLIIINVWYLKNKILFIYFYYNLIKKFLFDFWKKKIIIIIKFSLKENESIFFWIIWL